MVSKLTKAMGALSQNDEDDVRRTPATIVPLTTRSSSQHQERRKSARLNKRQDPTDVDDEISIDPHDSGTESDEEEIASITSSMSNAPPRRGIWYTMEHPPPVTANPAWKRDLDETESMDSFGRESGIMTGDNDSDTDGMATPTPLRRRLRDDDSSSPGKRGHEEQNPMADHPIAWRLRSFNNDRAVKVAARRCPVHVLISHPPIPMGLRFDGAGEDVEMEGGSWAAKRGRLDSHRPSLDFEKMVKTRIGEEQDQSTPSSSAASSPPTSSGPVTRSQINQ